MIHQPFTFTNGTTVKNRFYKASMDEQLADNGQPTDALAQLYARWAKGGAGILLTGHVMIDKRYLAEQNSTAVEDKSDFDRLQRWAAAGTADGAALIMQINHPGKQIPKTMAKTPVAPSAVPLAGMEAFFNPPRALSHEEILEIIERFANTAEIADQAGFSGVQIHAAHGYLLSQFLSPHHNLRTDEWGGSLENRLKIVLEIYQAIRKRVRPTFLVGIKLNSSDFQKGGFDEAESLKVIEILTQQGIDFIEISGGNYESPIMIEGVKESTKKREAYFLDFADKVRAISTTPLIITGGFRSEQAMNEALASGKLDFVGMAKPFAVNPDLPHHIQAGTYQTLVLKPIRTGISALDKKIGAMLEMSWYMTQMKRLSQGLPPQPTLSAWKVLAKMLISQGLAAFKKERA